ncbi:MAG TPA: hypothetical protein VKA80_13575 [Beijerinckiaceae bacterium]|nr:hypothetical protein [Beijerinckiaceae bacterium]
MTTIAGPKLPDGSDPLPASNEEGRQENEADLSFDDDWGDPFVTFTEWASPEEEEAWKDL